MKWIFLLIITFTQISCTIKIGDEKILKGGVIEFLEKHYDTGTRMPHPGGAMSVTVRPYFYKDIAEYCVMSKNKMVDNWCVDSNGFPIFIVQYNPVNTVVVSTGSSLLTMPGGSGWLVVIERNNIISDREWLETAKEKLEFKPEKQNPSSPLEHQ
ncbi:TPA: hypothetical protein R1888_004859 [Klebsiella oxytoca]|nr:hypothetical protein [Klebsiella oxytoca]